MNKNYFSPKPRNSQDTECSIDLDSPSIELEVQEMYKVLTEGIEESADEGETNIWFDLSDL